MFKLRMIPFLTVALAFLGQATVRGEFQAYNPPESSITQDMKLFLTSGTTNAGSTFSGIVGDQFVGPQINIVADATTKVVANGWATINNVNNGGTFTSATFTPVDSELFVDFSLRGRLLNAGDVKITVTDNSDQTFTFSEPKQADWDRIGVIALLGSGEFIKMVTVSTTAEGGFNELKQIAFSTLADHVVPEPSSMAIAGLGALGFVGFGLRHRLKK